MEDMLEDIMRVGEATGSQDPARRLIESLRGRIDRIQGTVSLSATRPRVACLEWMEPLLVAGHWVPQMVEMAGGEDCLGDGEKASFRVEWQDVLDSKPDVVVVMPCGFDVRRGLQETHLLTGRDSWASLPAVGNSQVYVVDASAYFSRSGPRLVTGLEMMAEILHPELFTGMVPQAGAACLYGTAAKS